MPLFEYRGLDRAGRSVRGNVDADNLRAARVKLKRDNIYVVDIRDKTKVQAQRRSQGFSLGSKRIPVGDLALMTRQLATMLKANVPLVESLLAVSEQVENPTLKVALADCKNMVNEGSPFFRALAKYPKIFDKIY